jgi:hypothetical protein
MNQSVHDIGMLASGVTFGSAMMTWLGENSNAIGALIAIASFILTGVFLILNYRLNKMRLEFDRRNSQKADK